MAIDIAAKLAELRAKKALEAAGNKEIQDAQKKVEAIKEATVPAPVAKEEVPVNTSVGASSVSRVLTNNQAAEIAGDKAVTTAVAKTEMTIGTARTSEIDHMQFMEQMQELATAIHTQHPKMPVLLMLIHKHLRNDPELVTTISEEEIGVIVNGLKIQTKTELVGTIAKQSKARDKKTNLSTDMF